MDEQTEFVSLIAHRLDALAIPYMLTGSMVLAFYSLPRMTRDIDLVVDISPGQVSSFVNAFSADCYVDEVAVMQAVRSRGMFNIIHNEWVFKADFIVRKNEPFRQLEFDRRVELSFAEENFTAVTPEDLVLSKLCWARDSHSERQFEDIRMIVRDKPDLDRSYVNQWAESLGVLELWQKVVS